MVSLPARAQVLPDCLFAKDAHPQRPMLHCTEVLQQIVAMGHKRTFRSAIGTSALPPESGHSQCKMKCPLWAIKRTFHTVARCSLAGGTIVLSSRFCRYMPRQ